MDIRTGRIGIMKTVKIILVMMVIGLLLGFFLIPENPGNSGNAASSGNTLTIGTGAGDAGRIVTDELQEIAELTVLEYDYKNATDIKDVLKLGNSDRFSFPIFPTQKQIILIYEGKIRIGIDAKELGIEVDPGNDGSIRRVTMTLPETKILSHEMDRNNFEYPLEKSGVLNGLSTEDYNLLETTAREQIEEQVRSSDLFERAENQLKETLTQYIAALYGGVKVEFRKEKS